MTSTTPLHDALAARDAAFAQLDATDWKRETKEIAKVILSVASHMSTFSANDVRKHLPEDVNLHRVGRVFVLAQNRGWIRAVDLVRSSGASARGSHVFLYRLVVAVSEVAA